MPTDHRLRLHDPKVTIPPVWPNPAKPDPENAIGVAEAGFRLGAMKNLELVTKSQVLEDEVTTRAARIFKDAKHQNEKAHHRRARVSVPVV